MRSMMEKKRVMQVVCFILCVVMMVCLCACGKKQDKGGDTTGPQGNNNQQESNNSNRLNPTSPCVTLAAEDSGYIYDTVTYGTGVWGTLQTVITPVVNQPACTMVFDNVFKIDMNTKEVYSLILDDWYWESEDTLVMKLKDNVYFSNGQKATPEDLLYSYTCYKQYTSTALAEVQFDLEKSCVRDDGSVALVFTLYNTTFFTYNVYLYCKEWAESVGWESTAWQDPVGSGAYKVVEFVNNDHITFEAREDYWNKDNDPVVIKRWVQKYYSDVSTMAMDIELGTIAFCAFTSTDYERFQKNGGDGYDVYAGEAGCCYIFCFGMSECEAFYDKNVRLAIAHGIPWEEFGEATLGVNYRKVTSYVPETSPEYLPTAGYEYDVELAKSLLKEAGYDESNPLKLYTVMMDVPFYSKSCEAFEYYCSQIGVQFTYDLKDIPAAVIDWNTPGGGCQLGWTYNNLGSPTQSMTRGYTYCADNAVNQWSFVDDEIFDNLWFEAAKETDEAKRIELSKQAQQRAYDECFSIPYSSVIFEVAYRTDTMPLDVMKLGVMSNEYYNMTTMSVASTWGK